MRISLKVNGSMEGKKMEILKALESYVASDNDEEKFIQEIVSFIENNDNAFSRTNLSGHVTGSAWVLSPDGKKSLFTHHKKLNRWLQLGGHSDGNQDTWSVALREAQEESGILDIEFVTDNIFDVDIHTFSENLKKQEPEHKHYDIRFLLKANSEDFIVSEESNSLKWVNNNEIPSLYGAGEIDLSMYRMYEKLNSFINKI